MRHKRIKLSAIILLGIGQTGLHAQENVNATGKSASGSGGSVSYSVGQVAYQTHSSISGSVEQGVQQPYEISTVTGMETAEGINLSVTAYPNPTTDFLTLNINDNAKTSHHDLSLMSYILYDMTGKHLQNEKITDSQTNIVISNLVPATYFVKVIQGNTEVKTFKIIKTQ